MSTKIPVSVLVVIHTPGPDFEVLLLDRVDHPGHWQSVTGSQRPGETLRETLMREVHEETGLDAGGYRVCDWKKTNVFEIFPYRRHRYAPGVTHNTEHVFSLEVPARVPVVLSPHEHLGYRWLPWEHAAAAVFSWSNRNAILELPKHAGIYGT